MAHTGSNCCVVIDTNVVVVAVVVLFCLFITTGVCDDASCDSSTFVVTAV